MQMSSYLKYRAFLIYHYSAKVVGILKDHLNKGLFRNFQILATVAILYSGAEQNKQFI